MEKSKIVYLIIISFLLLKIFHLLSQRGILWDSAVYLGMGKYIFSLGKVGFWEPARPLILPLFLGFFWRSGLNAIVFGRILIVFFSVGCLYLTYLIGRKVFNEKVGVIATFLLAFSPSFLLYSSSVLTGIPSTFFALLSVYLLIHKRYFLSGLFIGLGFMTRFLQLFVLLILLLYLMVEKKKIRNLTRLGYGLALAVVPYLILNSLSYKNAIYPFIFQVFMSRYTGWIYHEGLSFYFISLLKESFLVLFLVVGIVAILIKRRSKQMMIMGIFLSFFIFYNLIAHKEVRFVLTFLPYMYLIVSFGILKGFDNIRKEKDMMYFVILVFGVIWVVQVATQFEVPTYREYPEFEGYLREKEIEGEVWISNPIFAVDFNNKVDELIYYPIYNSKKIEVIKERINEAKHILIDTCDILSCPPNDGSCFERTNEFLGLLRNRFELVYYKKGECDQFIFS